MKAKKAILIALVLTAAVFNFNLSQANTLEGAHKKTIKVKLNSMQCGMCVATITKSLNSVDGVTKVKIDLKKKIATITFNSDVTDQLSIENAITSAGYDANDKTADPVAYQKLSGCCKKP